MKIIWRIMDANLNRTREGLRVCEDVARFAIADSPLTKSFKLCRHKLSQAVLKFPVSHQTLLHSRESQNDIGKKSYIRDERKMTVKSLLLSNFKRIEESLRVLEECAKLAAPPLCRQFQSLRFTVYELEKRTITKF